MLFALASLSSSGVADTRCVAPTALAGEPENMTLFHVQVITRHGQRTALNNFLPKNGQQWTCDSDDAISPREEANPSVYYRRYKVVFDADSVSFPQNCRAGDLLVDGMKQHKELGQAYRKRFVEQTHFLPENYDPDMFYFASSFIERTFRSQEAFIIGLYPIKSNNEVVTINTAETNRSPLFPSSAICQEQKVQSDMYIDHEEYKTLGRYEDRLKEGLTEVGLLANPKNITNFCEWAVTTNCKLDQSPQFLTQDVIDACHEVFAQNQFLKYSLGERGVASSYIFKEMLYILDKRLTGKTNVHFAHFSAHDTSLAAMLMTLVPNQVFKNIPPFASHILVELYKNNEGKAFIRYLYNGQIVRFENTDNNGLISYDDFKAFMKPFLNHCHDVPEPNE